jgi:uncharacterized Zn-finger protein
MSSRKIQFEGFTQFIDDECTIYKCNYCGAQSSRLRDCIDHIRKHTGEKPYVCDCGFSTAWLRSLKLHISKCAHG